MTAHRLVGSHQDTHITITVNGELVEAYAGESIAAALLAAGVRAFRRTQVRNAPRGFFCGMGMCFDCLVTVDGAPNVRSCLTPVRAGCEVLLDG